MQPAMRLVIAAGVVATGVTVAGPVVPAARASACTGNVRYAASSNTVYLSGGEMSLPELAAACPAAPIRQVDPRARIWQLNADLVVENGAVLHIRGTMAGRPGRVDTLRLSSPADGRPGSVVSITARHGTITIESTRVTSWDPAANRPDTDPRPPSSAGAGARGRAFIRAVSFLDPSTGAARQSRLDIVDSDLGHLGWYAPESYGVAFKARGCDVDHPRVCARLKVFGSERRSRFHHNVMGTYTFGARSMVFDRNEYADNVMYGLDPHDDSDYLTITRNHFHHNGGHGLICSKRCDHLRIVRNESDHNGVAARTGRSAAADNPVHGIMIHVGVTDSVIENNSVHDNPTGAGIAVFDSMNDVIRNNTLRNNRFGLRLSVGSRDNRVEANTVTGSRSYGIYSYPGSGRAIYGEKSGRPTGNVFTRNTFDAGGQGLAYLKQTDRTRFVDNQVIGGVGRIVSEETSGNVWQGVGLPASGVAIVRSAARRGG